MPADAAIPDVPPDDCIDYTEENNAECYKSMLWAQKASKSHPENYPPGSKSLADFQCALYLKGDINGVNEPGPAFHCWKAPCAQLTAPIEKHGAMPDSVGTAYCMKQTPGKDVRVDEAPSALPNLPNPAATTELLPNCSVADGSAKSAVYPCLCQGNAQNTCKEESYCWPAPLFCSVDQTKSEYQMEGNEPDGSSAWWFGVIIAVIVALILMVGAVAGKMYYDSAKVPKKKRAVRAPQASGDPYQALPTHSAPPGPAHVELPPFAQFQPAPMAGLMPMGSLYAAPVSTRFAPMPVAQPVAQPFVQPAPVQYSVAAPIQYRSGGVVPGIQAFPGAFTQ
eukprot:TRINITY_DN27140_c0_g1_i1.p2 TRINITY_DN27140_c0_g1~~TRINITY_DN27140_c0_g1_i1.p2  ORF type:complete len:337 (-),score=64.52 TRINITY_DN27140_c0_g1_i1:278-1288(-)